MNQQGVGLDLDMTPRKVMSYLRNPSKIADLLTKQDESTGQSAAQVFADLFTVQRINTKALADVHGVKWPTEYDEDGTPTEFSPMPAEKMDDERAAELLSGALSGDGVEIVQVFNVLEERQDRVLREVMGEEKYQAFVEAKRSHLYTSRTDDSAEE